MTVAASEASWAKIPPFLAETCNVETDLALTSTKVMEVMETQADHCNAELLCPKFMALCQGALTL